MKTYPEQSELDQMTVTSARPLYEVTWSKHALLPTITMTPEPSTAPPSGTFNNPVMFVPDNIETDAERALRKKKRRQQNKLGRPAWRL